MFDALKKLEETKDSNTEDLELMRRKKTKLIQKFKKLEDAFKNLSLDFPDDMWHLNIYIYICLYVVEQN